MKNVKYIVTAVLLVCMLALTLAACNDPASKPGEETTPKAGATTVAPTSTEAPTTEAPTTEAPTTEAPTTENAEADVEPDANASADKLTPATDAAEDFGQMRPL